MVRVTANLCKVDSYLTDMFIAQNILIRTWNISELKSLWPYGGFLCTFRFFFIGEMYASWFVAINFTAVMIETFPVTRFISIGDDRGIIRETRVQLSGHRKLARFLFSTDKFPSRFIMGPADT